jgi:hypothetical protein
MNNNKIVSNEELILSNMFEIQAVIRILKKKGITTEDEILNEVFELKKEMEEKIKKSSRENLKLFLYAKYFSQLYKTKVPLFFNCFNTPYCK